MKRPLRLISRLLLCVSLVAWAAGSPAQDVRPSGRVVSGVVVREQPSASSRRVGALSPDAEAKLEQEVPGWYRVRLADGTVGYVSKAWTVVSQAPAMPLSAPLDGRFLVHILDVGTGLAVFIEGPGFTMLYDGGSQDDLATGADNRILAYLRSIRPDMSAIDHLVLSHPHKDHVELLHDVFDRYIVRNVWDSGALNPTRGYCRFLRKVETEPGLLYHDAIASGGMRIATFRGSGCSGTVRILQAAMMSAEPVRLGPGASMSILHRDAERHSDPNDNSVVVRLDLGGRRVLLAGDAEGGGRATTATAPSSNSIEAKLLACCRDGLRSDVLIVGHHGSLTSSRRPFLDAVGASVFIISSGPHPYQGVQLPDPEVMAELASRGRVFSTKDGDEACLVAAVKIGPDADESPGGCNGVVVTIDRGELTVEPSSATD